MRTCQVQIAPSKGRRTDVNTCAHERPYNSRGCNESDCFSHATDNRINELYSVYRCDVNLRDSVKLNQGNAPYRQFEKGCAEHYKTSVVQAGDTPIILPGYRA